MIARSIGQILLDPQVSFCSLNGSMPERNLNLLQCRVAFVGEFGEGAPEIVRGDGNSNTLAILLNGGEDRLRTHSGTDVVTLVHAPQQAAV